MCQGADNSRMVQCDTCDSWCHFDCVGVGDEVNDKEWNRFTCTKNRENASSQTQNSVLSPMAVYGTPPEEQSNSVT